jgi:hypothetical protein
MTEAGFLETLKRVEDVAVILTRMEDINVVLGKITTIEAFIDRFGTLEALIERFESVENQLYYLKDMLNIDEAAKYLNISKGQASLKLSVFLMQNSIFSIFSVCFWSILSFRKHDEQDTATQFLSSCWFILYSFLS